MTRTTQSAAATQLFRPSAEPAIRTITPVYIGWRIQRYGPRVWSCAFREGIGDGVTPRPKTRTAQTTSAKPSQVRAVANAAAAAGSGQASPTGVRRIPTISSPCTATRPHPIARLRDRDRVSSVATCSGPVSYTHLRAHETVLDLVCRLLLEKK